MFIVIIKDSLGGVTNSTHPLTVQQNNSIDD